MSTTLMALSQYKLTAFNDNGGRFTCADTVVRPVTPEWITTYFAPNAFSPDYGLGKVNVFQPVGLGISEYEINVYSPYGKLVWHSTELEKGSPTGAWNGQMFNNGEAMPSGTYTWFARMRFDSGIARTAKGTVTLLR